MSNLLSIEESRCTRCGQCAAACPMGLVVMGSRFPRTVRSAAERCIRCGHCIAACPVQELRHEWLPADQCRPLPESWRGTPETVGQLLRGRRSIRRYRPDAVDKSTLLALLDAARYAPTAMNSETVQWIVVYDSARVKTIAQSVIEWMRELTQRDQAVAGRYNAASLVAAWEAGFDPILRSCPHLLVAHDREDEPRAPTSCAIALTTAELAALPLGLGTCWAGFLNLAAAESPAVRLALGLPQGHRMYGGLMIGYPAETYYCIPPRKELRVEWL